jgi:uncharacterized protein (DUF433 family)
MIYQNHITINAQICFGKPCIKGTRITTYDVLGWLASGMSILEIIDDFPELKEQDVYACLAYAASKERKLMVAA